MITTDKRIDDLVLMLDNFMESGGGHMNVTVNEDGGIDTEYMAQKEVRITTLDDCPGDMCCKIPNLFEGLDNVEENDEF